MSDEPPTGPQRHHNKQPIQSIITLTVVMDFFMWCGDYFVEVVGWVRIDWVRSVMVCQLKSERS